jgi:hypothetical protein
LERPMFVHRRGRGNRIEPCASAFFMRTEGGNPVHSHGTVKFHLHTIYQKLGVHSRIALMIALAGRGRSKPSRQVNNGRK